MAMRIGTFLLVPAMLVLAVPALAQKINVKLATPNQGAQATANLDVTIDGSGFGPGAQARFVLSSTDSTDGVVVKNTRFVSSTQLVATIDIAETATLAYFDIKVTLNGRTGKGTDLFQVVQKGGGVNACATQPLDTTRFELVGVLNHLLPSGTPAYGPTLGRSTALVATAVLLPDTSIRSLLFAVVGTGRDQEKVEVFILDPMTGAILDGQRLCPSCDVQPHVQLTTVNGHGTARMGTGHVNADGVPDIAALDPGLGLTTWFVSSVTSSGLIQYTAVGIPKGGGNCCGRLAMGDLDGLPGDEIAISNIGGGSGKGYVPPAVYLYRVVGTTAVKYRTVQPITVPAIGRYDGYGTALAIGDVTSDGRPDLIVSAHNRTVDGVRDSGHVFVHEGRDSSGTVVQDDTALTLRPAVATGDHLGFGLAVGNLAPTGGGDLLALAGGNGRGEVFVGPMINGQSTNPASALTFGPGLAPGWVDSDPVVGDLNGDGLGDVVVGAPWTVSSSACSLQGTVFVHLQEPGGGWTMLSMQALAEADDTNFGFRVAVTDGLPFILVGDPERNVGTAIGAGQAFLYRVKP